MFASGFQINFAFSSFKWANLASKNAGVTTAIVGIAKNHRGNSTIFASSDDGSILAKDVLSINAYLVPGADVIVEKRSKPVIDINELVFGSKPADGGGLVLTKTEVDKLQLPLAIRDRLILRFFGSEQFINGRDRYCLWVHDDAYEEASQYQTLALRFKQVASARRESTKASTVAAAAWPYKFTEIRQRGDECCLNSAQCLLRRARIPPSGSSKLWNCSE